jgi:hypothetical protein
MLTHGSVKADPLQALHCQTASTLLPQNDDNLKNIVNSYFELIIHHGDGGIKNHSIMWL